jgi:hypothetical protein
MRSEAKTSPRSFLANFEYPIRARFYPLGFPLDLETNSEEVILAAKQAWGRFTARFEETPVRLCLGVSEHEAEMLHTSEPQIVSQEHLITTLWDQFTFVVCDLRSGFAFGRLTKKAAADHPFLRYRFLQGSTMNMLVHKFLAPVHGALIARNGVGVLLCGDSFAGKSTLAYACARAGWTYLTDDGTYLVRARTDRYAVANPYYTRLREDAPALFPELEGHKIAVRPNGKIGMEISTAALAIATAEASSIEHVVFLNRSAGARAHLVPHSKEVAMKWCEQYICYGEAAVRAEQRQALLRLLDAGLWEMGYSGLDDAIACLESLTNKRE